MFAYGTLVYSVEVCIISLQLVSAGIWPASWPSSLPRQTHCPLRPALVACNVVVKGAAFGMLAWEILHNIPVPLRPSLLLSTVSRALRFSKFYSTPGWYLYTMYVQLITILLHFVVGTLSLWGYDHSISQSYILRYVPPHVREVGMKGTTQ